MSDCCFISVSVTDLILFIQFYQVNVGSIADKAGLLAGDALIKVNTEELFNLRHKDAQDSLVRAGNSFELTVSRYVSVLVGQSCDEFDQIER